FRLRPESGTIALAARQNEVICIIDYVTYAGLSANQSFGSKTDGDPLNRGALGGVSPAAANAGGAAIEVPKLSFTLADPQTVKITWPTTSGQRYRIQTTDDLTRTWATAGELNGTGAGASFTDGLPQGVRTRFYRVIIP
ncbi:MAG TPA: hypothetical protein VK633_12470, partial [Verrucomicrobiae bacterium]|nr:hypothetical protein [Verrucomicrobiae bacterium]